MRDDGKNDQPEAKQRGQSRSFFKKGQAKCLQPVNQKQNSKAAGKPFRGQLYHWAVYSRSDKSAAFAIGVRRLLSEGETVTSIPLRITSQLVCYSQYDGVVETLNSRYQLKGDGNVYLVDQELFSPDMLASAHAENLAEKLGLHTRIH